MPTYIFHTERTSTDQHYLDIELAVDMGTSTNRITDRMAKTAAENDALADLVEGEKIVAVFREDGTQIWPRKRTKKDIVQATAPRESVGVITTVHNEEEE